MNDEVVPGMADAIDRRRLVLGLAKGELAAAAKVSREGLRPLLKGYRREYNDATIVGLARALRWDVDWYDRMRRGDAPAEDGSIPADIDARVGRLEEDVATVLRLLQDVLGRSEGAPREGGGSR